MRTIQFQMNARKHAHKNCTWKKTFFGEICLQSEVTEMC